MKSTALLTGLLLTANAVHALPARPVPSEDPAAKIFELPLPSPGKADERALYHLLGSAGRELEFEVRVNRKVYLDEKLTLPADAAGAAFELLAGDTAHRDRLFKAAENWRNRVRVTVKVDGRAVREVSFQELLAASRDLQRLPLRLGKVAGGARSFSPEAAGAPKTDPLSWLAKDCTTNCQSGYYSCMSSSCPGQEECDVCNEQFAACISYCTPVTCTDPKSVSYHDSSTITNAQWAGSQCRSDWYYGGLYYDQYNLTVRTDHYTDTTYCDNHTTSSYYSTYSSGYCEHPTPWQCSYPSGYAFNICY